MYHFSLEGSFLHLRGSCPAHTGERTQVSSTRGYHTSFFVNILGIIIVIIIIIIIMFFIIKFIIILLNSSQMFGNNNNNNNNNNNKH